MSTKENSNAILAMISGAGLTPAGEEAALALLETGSTRKAAALLGISRQSVQDRLHCVGKRSPELLALIKGDPEKNARQGHAPEFGIDHEVPDGLTLRGTSILHDADGKTRQYWNKTRQEGREASNVVSLPGAKIASTATLYDQEGRVTQQWVREIADAAERESAQQAIVAGFVGQIERETPAPTPRHHFLGDLMTVYPVGDHHLGMYAWGEETGGSDHSLKRGESLIMGAVDYLMAASPRSEEAAILVLGDYLHADGYEPVTPQHRHALDVDSRYQAVVRVAIRTLRYMVKAALQKHARVTLIIEIGNHDISTAQLLMECFTALYENEPRVTVDNSPKRFHCFTWGNNMIGTHHGDKVKMAQLPLLFATDFPDAWGQTRNRYIHTGHVHHDSSFGSRDLTGATVESHRVLPPPDAYAAMGGYRSPQSMKAIVYHREHGETSRYTCSPQMLDQAAA